jgi:hypothetical protein
MLLRSRLVDGPATPIITINGAYVTSDTNPRELIPEISSLDT